MGKRVCRSLARSRAACFARPNRRACSQAMTNSLTLLFQALLPRKFLINLFHLPRLFLIHLTLFVLFYHLHCSTSTSGFESQNLQFIVLNIFLHLTHIFTTYLNFFTYLKMTVDRSKRCFLSVIFTALSCKKSLLITCYKTFSIYIIL